MQWNVGSWLMPDWRSGISQARFNRPHRGFVDRQLEHVRPAVVADDIKVELGAGNFGEVKFCNKNRLAIEIRAGEDLAQGTDNRTPASHQHRIRTVAERNAHARRKRVLAQVLTRRQYEATPFERDMPH